MTPLMHLATLVFSNAVVNNVGHERRRLFDVSVGGRGTTWAERFAEIDRGYARVPDSHFENIDANYRRYGVPDEHWERINANRAAAARQNARQNARQQNAEDAAQAEEATTATTADNADPVTDNADPVTDNADPVTANATTDPVTANATTDPVTANATTDPVTANATTDPVTANATTDPVTDNATAGDTQIIATTEGIQTDVDTTNTDIITNVDDATDLPNADTEGINVPTDVDAGNTTNPDTHDVGDASEFSGPCYNTPADPPVIEHTDPVEAMQNSLADNDTLAADTAESAQQNQDFAVTVVCCSIAALVLGVALAIMCVDHKKKHGTWGINFCCKQQ